MQFTAEQYRQLAEVGILHSDERYELINGLIYQTHPVSSEHSYTVKSVYDQLTVCSDEEATVFSQSPIRFGNSEPEPDIVALKTPSQQYRERLLEPADYRSIQKHLTVQPHASNFDFGLC